MTSNFKAVKHTSNDIVKIISGGGIAMGKTIQVGKIHTQRA